MPAIGEHLTAIYYVDSSLHEPFLVRSNRDNVFNIYNLTFINSYTLITQAVNDNKVIIKAYVDQFHHENERPRRDLGVDFYN